MKRLTLALVLCLLLTLCACTSSKYQKEITALVTEQAELLHQYTQSGSALTEELTALGVQAVEDADGIRVFEMYYTGLFDGGVEYGFYYAPQDTALNKTMTAQDHMVIEPITGHWYYYEWHNG